MLPLECRPCRALQLYGDLCLQAEAENQKSLVLYDQIHHTREKTPEIRPDSTRNLMFSCSQVLQLWWTEIDYEHSLDVSAALNAFHAVSECALQHLRTKH